MRIYGPICEICKHFRYNRKGSNTCAAFPDGIPSLIGLAWFDHRAPYPGDNSIQFEKYEDRSTLPPYLARLTDRQLSEYLNSRLHALEEARRTKHALPVLAPDDNEQTKLKMLLQIRERNRRIGRNPFNFPNEIAIFPNSLIEAMIEQTVEAIRKASKTEADCDET